MDKIATIYQDMKHLENMKNNIVAKYHEIITDNSIDIENRWKFFMTFAKEYKITQDNNFIPESIKNNFPDFDWYKDLGYLPNVTINTVCFVQMLENVIGSIKEVTGYMNNDFYNFYRQHPEQLKKLKEDILKHNLFSFVYTG